MRRFVLFVAAAFLCLGLASASAQEQKAPDATVVDPEVHNVVLDNDHVRVLEVMASPGHASPMHSHPPLVFMSCDSARTRMTPAGGETFIFDAKPGTVMWLEDVQHAWELFAGNLRGYAVELKSAQAGRPPAAPKAGSPEPAASADGSGIREATVVDPEVHNVVLENNHVRVFEAIASAGYESPLHSHPPLVVLSCDTARMKLTPAGGEAQILDLKPGTVLWLEEGAQHSWELFGGELHVFGVEPKSAQAGGAATAQ